MTTDTFENTLRDLLHEAADAQTEAYVEPDPQVVLAHGRRVVRRRRLAMAGASAAAALVLGVGGWAVLSDPLQRDRALPAHSVAPGPVGEVVATLDQLTLRSTTDGEPLDIPGSRRFAVSVDTAAPAGLDLRYWAVDDDGRRTLLAGSSLDGVDPLGATWGTGSSTPHSVVGILPAGAQQWTLVLPESDDDLAHQWTSDTAPLPGTSWQAFSALFEEAADAQGTRRLIWLDAQGAVHDEAGLPVPSARLGIAQNAVVFVDGSSSTLGAVTDSNFVTTSTALPAGTPPVITAGREENGTLSTLFVLLLPPGRTDPRIVAGTGQTLAWSNASELPGGVGTVVAAQLEAAAGTPAPSVTSVTVTEPTGTTKTYRDF